MIETTTDEGNPNNDEDDSSSLFQQSAGRLPLSSADISKAKGNNNPGGLSSGHEKLGGGIMSTTTTERSPSIGSTKKLSMAQLKARKIMSESILHNNDKDGPMIVNKVKQIQQHRLLVSPRHSTDKTSSPHVIQSPKTTTNNLMEKKKSDSKLNNIKKDVNYYAVLAKIQKVVSADEPISLGKILADANRRGLPMDVVTEMYKQERFKANSLKVSSNSNNTMKVTSQDKQQSSNKSNQPTMTNNNSHGVTTVVDESEAEEQYVLPSDAAYSTIEQRCHIEIKENVVNKDPQDNSEIKDLEKSKKPPGSPTLNSHTQIVEPLEENPIPTSCDITSVKVGKPKVVTDTISPSTQSVGKEEFINSDVSKSSTSKVEHSCRELPKATTNTATADARSTSTQSVDKEKFINSDVSKSSTTNVEHSCPKLPKAATDTISPSAEEKELASLPGLNEFQLRQLTQLVEKAEELRDSSDLSAQVCETTSIPPVDRKMKMAGDAASDEIDAFFSRFSIQTQMDQKDTHLSKDADNAHDVKDISPNNNSNRSDSERNDEIDDADSVDLQNDESGIKKGKDPVKGLSKDIGGFEEKHHLSGEESHLPKHLGLWKSPWQRKHLPGGSGTFLKPDRAGGTSSTFSKRHSASTSGYLNIDFYSLYEATVMQVEDEDIDQAPWEYRDVGQRFLNEKSLESRNWFGKTQSLSPV